MNDTLTLVICFALGSAVGVFIGLLWQQARVSVLKERSVMLEQAGLESSALRQENESLKLDVARLQKEQEAYADKLQWAQTAQDTLKDAFRSLAAQSLQSNAEEFIKRAKDQLSTMAAQLKGDWGTQKQEMKNLVEPLRDTLKTLDAQVQTLERRREGAYHGLQEQLKQLFETQQQLQTTTTTLAQALKSSSVRGKWGEVQLRRVVEMAGMVEHVDFREQQATEDGRPDMVIRLPNAGELPVDAKTPMAAYLEAMEASDDQTRTAKLKDHAIAIRSRIRDLGQKRYWQQFEHAPDFVVMFMPSDTCLCAAYERDGDLLDYAIQQRVMPTTPVTLLALLKAVAYGWQQQQIAENAHEIAEQGKSLYDRLLVFTEHLTGLGKHINQSVQDYNKTIASLENRVTPAARRLREMGVGSKDMPPPAGIELQARLPVLPESVEKPSEPEP